MMRPLLLCAVLLPVMLAGCPGRDTQTQAAIEGGHPGRGKRVLEKFDCGACHVIPGIRGARGEVGPPLDRYRRRVYVAGELPNTAEGLIRWIRHPTSVEPHTAMPDLGVSEAEARDIAAYLYDPE